jgi:hypothetical protein
MIFLKDVLPLEIDFFKCIDLPLIICTYFSTSGINNDKKRDFY